MAKNPELKTVATLDSREFDAGLKNVKQGVKDFESVGSGALDAIGAALGVNTGQVEKLTSSLRGLGAKLEQTGSKGAQSFGAILKSIGPVTGAIAGLGLGAAIAGFKALTAEAENFKNTVAGANIEMQTAAYVSTYQQTMHDFMSSTGATIADVESRWKKFWGTLGANAKAFFATGAWKEFNPWSSDVSNTQAYYNLRGQASSNASQAEQISKQLYELERRRSDATVEIARLNAEIADQMLVAKDASVSLAEREAAIAEAKRLNAEKSALIVPIEKQIADLLAQRNSLTSSSVDEVNEANQAALQSFNTQREITQQLLTIEKTQASITKSAGEQARAYAAAAAAARELDAIQKKMDQKKDEMSGIQGANTGNFSNVPVATPTLNITKVEEAAMNFKKLFEINLGKYGGVKVGIKPEFSEEEIQAIFQQVESSFDVFSASVAEHIGTLFGDLVNGENAFGNFANNVLSSFADMCIAVGKLAVQTGVTTIGIKSALESMNGYVAIAAGAALLVLGAAVKSGLKNAASGNYSSASISAGGSASGYAPSAGYGDGFVTRQSTVAVTGELKADGDQLVAVINSANKKRTINT